MKVFFDTSSLFKLYYQEVGSDTLDDIFTSYTITEIFLSELTKIEFASTVWKKFRMQNINEEQATIVLGSFENDFVKYTFIQIDNVIIEQARNLLIKYGKDGLRTLDSIQLSTAVLLNEQAGLFMSADNLLNLFLQQELLPTQTPGN